MWDLPVLVLMLTTPGLGVNQVTTHLRAVVREVRYAPAWVVAVAFSSAFAVAGGEDEAAPVLGE